MVKNNTLFINYLAKYSENALGSTDLYIETNLDKTD